MTALLQNELKRLKNGEQQHFRVIAAEKSLHCRLSELQLTLRADRIDQLESGELRLIDYKTGSADDLKMASWAGKRPIDPQLPLYAIAATELDELQEQGEIHELGWQAINPDSVKKGSEWKIFSDPGDPGIENWQQQLPLWRQCLTELASEYETGNCDIALRRDGDKACKKGLNDCEYRSLCRVTAVGSND